MHKEIKMFKTTTLYYKVDPFGESESGKIDIFCTIVEKGEFEFLNRK
jgi:hypothetical protein